MSEDVPLTAFDGQDGSDDAVGAGDRKDDSGSPDSEGPAEEPTVTEQPETPSLTYSSSPEGAPCAACGETVEKRWRAGEGGVSPDETGDGGVDDPDALICPDCKKW